MPYGTAVRIERGYKVNIMPTSLDVKVGESIRVVNQDNTTFAVGPFTVAAGHEVSMRFTNPGVLSGVCAVNAAGRFETYRVDSVTDEASFLEMLDILNDNLVHAGKEAVVFDHDCREGICGTCSLMIDGQAHGPQRGTATCQLHMRTFSSGATITVEPWRATAFPIVKDLMVDRSAFDRIVEAGGFITAPTGGAPDANLIDRALTRSGSAWRRDRRRRSGRRR
mgnify:CR=1 FL=1